VARLALEEELHSTNTQTDVSLNKIIALSVPATNIRIEHDHNHQTSDANSVRISPIPLSMERNGICQCTRHNERKMIVLEFKRLRKARTLEKRLFSILWAMESLRASGSLRSSIALFFAG
jgi:hypothetical protein